MRWLWVFAAVAMLGDLTACDTTKETLGFSRKAPDEFTVVTQRPLAVPPSFTLAPPGSPAAANAAQAPVAAQAADTVLGDQPAATTSHGWQQLAQNFGLTQRNPQIRAQLDKDNQGVATRDPDFTDRLAVWNKQTPPDPTVDAPQEATRIQSRGKKLDGKGVPTQGGKTKAPLEKLF